MKAGREMDALIAEKVFDYERMTEQHWSEAMGYKNDGSHNERIIVSCKTRDSIKLLNHRYASFAPNYSTSIAAAWDVLEKLSLMGIYMRISNVNGVGRFRVATEDRMTDFHTSAPHAICEAALKAVT